MGMIFKPFLRIFLGFLILLAIFNGTSFVLDTIEASRYRNEGSMVSGTVLTAKNYTVTEGGGGGDRSIKSRTKKPYSDFTVTYTVDGKEYTYDFVRIYGTYEIGQVIPVYYLNDSPGEKPRLSLERAIVDNIVITSILLIIGVGGILLTFRKSKKSLKAEENISDVYDENIENSP